MGDNEFFCFLCVCVCTHACMFVFFSLSSQIHTIKIGMEIESGELFTVLEDIGQGLVT